MKNYILYFCALITLGFASSCKSPTDFDVDRWNDKDTTNYPAPQELRGEWYLAYYETFGGMPDSVPNQMYMVNFETSKKVTGKANCNTLAGEYTAGTTPIGNTPDKALTFKKISTTKMNCGTGDLDAKFTTALGAAKQYFVFGDMLEITYTVSGTTQSQRMIFTRKQEPNNNADLLKGTEWTLVSFEQFGQPAEWIPVAFQENLNISFMGDSLAVGMAECGKFSADYWTNNKPLPGTSDYPLGMNITNSVPCNGNYGNRFLAALAGAKKYYRYGDSLEITYSTDNGITLSRMMFVRMQGINNKGALVNPTKLITPGSVVNSPNDPFTVIKTYSVDSATINIGVQYSGGCATHEFGLYGIVSSDGVEAVLTHDAKADPCNALIGSYVSLDILPFITEYKKITGLKTGDFFLIMRNAGTNQTRIYQIKF